MRGIKHLPIIGNVYGKWTVISTDTILLSNKTAWRVRCICGKEDYKIATLLIEGRSRSCISCSKTKYTPIESYFLSVQNRAKQDNLEFNLTVSYIQHLIELQNYKCALSGLDIILNRRVSYVKGVTNNSTASLDRIDSKLGYIVGNVQWLHKDVNMMKGTLTQHQFIHLCGLISKQSDDV